MINGNKDNGESKYAEFVVSNFKWIRSIISLGSGDGCDEVYFAKNGIATYATDINKLKTSALGLFASQHKLDDLHVNDLNILEKFPFDDDYFDSLYFKFGLHFFNDDQILNLIIPEIKRVVKPNGLIFIIYRLIESDRVFNENYSVISKNESSILLYDLTKKESTYRNIINEDKYYKLFSDSFEIKTFETQNENIYNKLSNDNNSLIYFSVMRNNK